MYKNSANSFYVIIIITHLVKNCNTYKLFFVEIHKSAVVKQHNM